MAHKVTDGMNPTHQQPILKRYQLKTWHTVALIIFGSAIFIGILLGILQLTYRGRFLPGVKIYGIYVGGLTQTEAQALLEKETSQYIETSTIIVNTNQSAAKAIIPASEVELKYDIQADISTAYQMGREGQLAQRFTTQIKLLLGLADRNPANISYNAAKIYTIIQPISKSLTLPAQNANFVITPQNKLSIKQEQPGGRLNLVSLLDDYSSTVSSLQRSNIMAKVTTQPATVTRVALEAHKNSLESFTRSPMLLTYNNKNWAIPSDELLSWISYAESSLPLREDLIQNYYYQQSTDNRNIGLDTTRIKNYLNSIAKDINQDAQDAKLSIENERAVVFQSSQDGRSIDLNLTSKTIADNLLSPQPANSIPLTVVVTKADITDDNIEQLGIKELLSEGASFFPGSSTNRLTNIRIGAARYNGVLLKPDQVFSFGELLGEVGPAQGYREGSVILEGRTESQYGGGLCQVSSTAFRAALLAGLPILERYNHSFAVDYYTQPYGVPGVDATIYYPSVDFKFKNDTSNYILIQTEMIGTTLKFRFYGTKEKSGVIRGPYFISGSNDATKPSKTVFYRDIITNGEVSKTNTFYTSYRSSLDFPPVN